MSRIIFFMAVFVLAACGGTVTITDTTRYAKVEDIIASNNKKYRYTIVAWQKTPDIKRYIIHSDSLYNIGDNIEIRNREIKSKSH